MTSTTIIYFVSLQITHTFLDQLRLILPLRNPKLASLPPTMVRGRPPEPRQAARTRRATPASSTPRPAMPAAARSRVLKRQSQSAAVPAVRVGRARVVSRRDIAPRLSGQKYPRTQFLEEVVALAMEMTKREQAMDSDDDESSDALEMPTPAGSRQRQRARNRVRHHLETVLTSSDPKALEHTMSLLEQVSVQPATCEAYQKAMQAFLEWCDSQSPPSDLDDPRIADLALCPYGNDLYARGHHKSSFERAVAAFLFHLPEFGRMGSQGLPRTYRALRGFRFRCPGRSRKPHPCAFWQVLAVDIAERGHVMMAVWVLLAFQAYLRPGECMSLQRRDLVPPSASVNNFWALLIFPSERSQRSKIGEADNSILLDSTWAQWMS